LSQLKDPRQKPFAKAAAASTARAAPAEPSVATKIKCILTLRITRPGLVCALKSRFVEKPHFLRFGVEAFATRCLLKRG